MKTTPCTTPLVIVDTRTGEIRRPDIADIEEIFG